MRMERETGVCKAVKDSVGLMRRERAGWSGLARSEEQNGKSDGSCLATRVLSGKGTESRKAPIRERVRVVRTLIRKCCYRRKKEVDPGRWEEQHTLQCHMCPV